MRTNVRRNDVILHRFCELFSLPTFFSRGIARPGGRASSAVYLPAECKIQIIILHARIPHVRRSKRAKKHARFRAVVNTNNARQCSQHENSGKRQKRARAGDSERAAEQR